MSETTASIVWTTKAEAFALMGKSVFDNPDAPPLVPFSEVELAKWASEGRFIAYIPPGSVASEFSNTLGRSMNARIPLQYRNLAAVHARGPAQWLVGKFGTDKEGEVQKVRYLAHLCVRWNEHPHMRPFYRSELKSATILKEGGSPAIITFGFRSAQLHCRPLQNVFHLVGTARKAFPPPK